MRKYLLDLVLVMILAAMLSALLVQVISDYRHTNAFTASHAFCGNIKKAGGSRL